MNVAQTGKFKREGSFLRGVKEKNLHLHSARLLYQENNGTNYLVLLGSNVMRNGNCSWTNSLHNLQVLKHVILLGHQNLLSLNTQRSTVCGKLYLPVGVFLTSFRPLCQTKAGKKGHVSCSLLGELWKAEVWRGSYKSILIGSPMNCVKDLAQTFGIIIQFNAFKNTSAFKSPEFTMLQ